VFALIILLSIGGRPTAAATAPYFATEDLCESAKLKFEVEAASKGVFPNMLHGVCVRTDTQALTR
jgi:hypothetical protein